LPDNRCSPHQLNINLTTRSNIRSDSSHRMARSGFAPSRAEPPIGSRIGCSDRAARACRCRTPS
jgi:hypothetical protein